MGTYNALEFGEQLRYHRLRLGWSAQKLAELYSEFVGREDSPPSPTFIYRVESGETKLELTRRVILASLVGMALPTLLEETSGRVDVSEYTEFLELYCRKWYQGTLNQEATTIQERTRQLGDAAFNAFGQEKKKLFELFGFYQILHADALWKDKPARGYDILSSTIEIARQEALPLLYVHALSQRAGIVENKFEVTKDPRSIQTASDDYANAVQERKGLSSSYSSLFEIRKGAVDAYIARDQTEFLSAIRLMSHGANQIGASSDDVRIVARLDYERYMLNLTKAYLYSPGGNPRIALAKLNELDRCYPIPKGKHRLTTRNIYYANAYLAISNYPLAVAHLEAALESASGTDEIGILVDIHTRLKNTSYWNDPDIGRIALKINQMKYPRLFR
jgi:transcriptional regulator with XRE-family HTH domain